MHMFFEAPGEGTSICRSAGPNGELIDWTCDHFVASQSLQWQNKNMEVVVDFESKPQKRYVSGGGRQNGSMVARSKDAQKLCQDAVDANYQEEARLRDVKKRMTCFMKEDG